MVVEMLLVEQEVPVVLEEADQMVEVLELRDKDLMEQQEVILEEEALLNKEIQVEIHQRKQVEMVYLHQ